jgi:hypothetical protein
VLLHVERNESSYSDQRVEGIQVEPLVPQRAPPGFQQRAGLHGIDLREHARSDPLASARSTVLFTFSTPLPVMTDTEGDRLGNSFAASVSMLHVEGAEFLGQMPRQGTAGDVVLHRVGGFGWIR